MGDVDLDAAMVQVMGKGRQERWMPLGETSLVALWDYLQVRRSRLSHLWLGEDGRPLATAAIYVLLKRLGKRAGIPTCILTGSATPLPSPTCVTADLGAISALLEAGNESRKLAFGL